MQAAGAFSCRRRMRAFPVYRGSSFFFQIALDKLFHLYYVKTHIANIDSFSIRIKSISVPTYFQTNSKIKVSFYINPRAFINTYYGIKIPVSDYDLNNANSNVQSLAINTFIKF